MNSCTRAGPAVSPWVAIGFALEGRLVVGTWSALAAGFALEGRLAWPAACAAGTRCVSVRLCGRAPQCCAPARALIHLLCGAIARGVQPHRAGSACPPLFDEALVRQRQKFASTLASARHYDSGAMTSDEHLTARDAMGAGEHRRFGAPQLPMAYALSGARLCHGSSVTILGRSRGGKRCEARSASKLAGRAGGRPRGRASRSR